MIRKTIALTTCALLAVGAFSLSGKAATDSCEWLAGDFHVHTVWSHDAFGGPLYDGDEVQEEAQDFYTLGWTPAEEAFIAASRGLDFLTITDHNNVNAQSDIGWEVFSDVGVIPVPGYENSIGGHAQMLGARTVYDNSVGVEAVAEQLRADGGAFQINHPADGKWETQLDGDLKYPNFTPDTMEVWNIGAWVYEPPFPATNDHEYPLRLYDRFLDRGDHVAATGGSDSHWRSTTAAQGPGQPTTWVCASEATWQGVIDGLKAGRTAISHQPPNYGGPLANMHAQQPDGTLASVIGDTIPAGTDVTVSVTQAPGAILRIVGDGGQTIGEVAIDSIGFAHTFQIPTDISWARAEVFYPDASDVRDGLDMTCNALAFDGQDAHHYCHGRLAMVSLTSPVYFHDPATELSYVGSTSIALGRPDNLVTKLVDWKGRALGGEPVTFSFQGATYDVITNENGLATVSVRAIGPPGTYEVTSDYAGADRYSASSTTTSVEVTPAN